MIAAALLACAVGVHPATMSKVVQIESGGRPFALNVNKLGGPQPRPTNAAEAVATARRYIALGYSVDLGLTQINSRNLAWLGVSVEQMLEDPCANLAAGGRILSEGYTRAVAQMGEGQPALRAALSAYNTGSLRRGFENGYVARYFTATVPAPAAAPDRAPPAPSALAPHAGDTAIFIREASHVVVD